jgi:hypothetical protein
MIFPGPIGAVILHAADVFLLFYPVLSVFKEEPRVKRNHAGILTI